MAAKKEKTTYAQELFIDHVRDFTGLGNPIILAAIVLIAQPSTFLYTIIGLALIELVCRALKVAFFVERPDKTKYTNLIQMSDAASFPSLHAARTAFVFFMLAAYEHQPLIQGVLYLAPVIVGATRIILRRHRMVDVIAGLAIGAIALGILTRIV